MPLISFQYSQYPVLPTDPFPNGQLLFRPMMIAHLLVPSSGRTHSCLVCLDTGADQCIFPRSFTTPLGLDPLQMKMHMTGGCGSSANPTYYADIEIQLRINGIPGVPMISLKTFAGFTPGMDAQGIGLLGQSGFFENFKTTFDHKNRLFHIET